MRSERTGRRFAGIDDLVISPRIWQQLAGARQTGLEDRRPMLIGRGRQGAQRADGIHRASSTRRGVEQLMPAIRTGLEQFTGA
jgi:hypothetical protein